MSRLYWVRHGESYVNLTKEFSHRLVDKPLTPKGVLQAQQTAELFAGKEVAAIYCSPMIRATETAQIIGQRIGLPVSLLENFRELNDGDLEKQPPSPETWYIFLGVIQAWKAGDLAASFPGGEDYYTLLDRMMTGIRKVLEDQPGRPVLVVAHGGSFVSTLPAWCEDAAEVEGRPVDNCAVTEIEVEIVDGTVRGRLVRWADVSHLQGEAALTISGLPEEFVDEKTGRMKGTR